MVNISEVRRQIVPDHTGAKKEELLLSLSTDLPFPAVCSAGKYGCFLVARGGSVLLSLPVFSGELKYFFPNPSDYYYLPEEDEAVHKSVASFVPKTRRRQATASLAYTKKRGVFLPEFRERKDTPLFYSAYHKLPAYTEFGEDMDFFSEDFLDRLETILSALMPSPEQLQEPLPLQDHPQ